MKKTLKKVVALVLVVALLFTFTSCGKNDSPVIEFENPLGDVTVTEAINMAESVNEDRVYATGSNSTFEVTAIKSKSLVFSGVAASVTGATYSGS